MFDLRYTTLRLMDRGWPYKNDFGFTQSDFEQDYAMIPPPLDCTRGPNLFLYGRSPNAVRGAVVTQYLRANSKTIKLFIRITHHFFVFTTSILIAATINAVIDYGDWKYYGYGNVARDIFWFGFFIFVVRTVYRFVKKMNKKAVKIIVHGLVQGVFYRQSTQKMATMLKIQGTVRNCDDGTVEIFAEGEEENVEKLMEWCKNGPPKSRVTKVATNTIPIKNFIGFNIIRH
jgi:acylphosphatase